MDNKFKTSLPPVKGTVMVISPQEAEEKSPKIYYLVERHIVYTWMTRQGRKMTLWCKDTLNNTWIILETESPK